MNEMIKTPEFLFESSWEVCNKVGGIYTVLSTKAHTLQQIFNDKVIFRQPIPHLTGLLLLPGDNRDGEVILQTSPKTTYR